MYRSTFLKLLAATGIASAMAAAHPAAAAVTLAETRGIAAPAAETIAFHRFFMPGHGFGGFHGGPRFGDRFGDRDHFRFHRFDRDGFSRFGRDDFRFHRFFGLDEGFATDSSCQWIWSPWRQRWVERCW